MFKVTGLDRVNDMWLNMRQLKKMKEKNDESRIGSNEWY